MCTVQHKPKHGKTIFLGIRSYIINYKMRYSVPSSISIVFVSLENKNV